MNNSSFVQDFLFFITPSFSASLNIGKYSNLLLPAYLSGMVYTVEYSGEIDTICKDEACQVCT
jgi:hypothetical protein